MLRVVVLLAVAKQAWIFQVDVRLKTLLFLTFKTNFSNE
jgi:hypothetical protein